MLFQNILKWKLHYLLPKSKSIINQWQLIFRKLSTESDILLEDDVQFNKLKTEISSHLLPKFGHKVLIVQPSRTHGKLFTTSSSEKQSFFEAKALVNTLKWNLVDCKYVNTRLVKAKTFFTTGNYEELADELRCRNDITAVFVNWSCLSSLQIMSMERDWQKIVYDRYMMVLQIFKLHAQTSESKLQVQLAELPYFRSRLYGYHIKSHSDVVLQEYERSLSGFGLQSSSMNDKMFILKAREHKIKSKIEELVTNREVHRSSRRKSNIPIISVLGYTNSGKTSLIRCLTHDEKITPEDCLFATLDVTYHEFFMKFNTNNFGMNVLLIDTIGFLSEIPTGLIAAFRSTLQDTMETDLLIHVVDLSNEHWKEQMSFTLATLYNFKLPEKLMNSIITVGTKIDCINSSTLDEIKTNNPEIIPISNKTGENLSNLQSLISQKIQANIEFIFKQIKVGHGSSIYQWINSNAVIQNLQVSRDSQNLLLDVIFSPSTWAQFQNKFHKKS